MIDQQLNQRDAPQMARDVTEPLSRGVRFVRNETRGCSKDLAPEYLAWVIRERGGGRGLPETSADVAIRYNDTTAASAPVSRNNSCWRCRRVATGPACSLASRERYTKIIVANRRHAIEIQPQHGALRHIRPGGAHARQCPVIQKSVVAPIPAAPALAERTSRPCHPCLETRGFWAFGRSDELPTFRRSQFP